MVRPIAAALERGFEPNQLYAALTNEDSRGHVWLDLGGEAVEVDATHFLRGEIEPEETAP